MVYDGIKQEFRVSVDRPVKRRKYRFVPFSFIVSGAVDVLLRSKFGT